MNMCLSLQHVMANILVVMRPARLDLSQQTEGF